MINILMVGGGSAGHIAPMVAVAEALPNADITFVCSDRPSDGNFLTIEGRPFHTLPLPRGPDAFIRAFTKSRRILAEKQSDVIFSKGGSVSVPLCLAAWTKRIPIVVHESDAVMGRANRIVSLIAHVVLRGTEIGNPIRSRITQGKKVEGLRITNLSGQKPVLLVMGGSQGAQTINDAVTTHLDELLATVDIIHLTGPGKKTAQNKPGYYATEFGSDVLPHLYAAADLAISRAGASSIAELAACGIPMILIPIRGLAGDHQVKNAIVAQKTYDAIVLPQDRLEAEFMHIVGEAVRSKTSAAKKRYTEVSEAARLIAETIVQSVAR